MDTLELAGGSPAPGAGRRELSRTAARPGRAERHCGLRNEIAAGRAPFQTSVRDDTPILRGNLSLRLEAPSPEVKQGRGLYDRPLGQQFCSLIYCLLPCPLIYVRHNLRLPSDSGEARRSELRECARSSGPRSSVPFSWREPLAQRTPILG